MHNAYTSSALAFGQFRTRSKSLYRKPTIIRRKKKKKKCRAQNQTKTQKMLRMNDFSCKATKSRKFSAETAVVKAVNKQTKFSVYNEHKGRDQFKSI